MYTLLAFLGVGGFACFIFGVIWLVLSKIRKKDTKDSKRFTLISLGVFIVSTIAFSTEGSDDSKDKVVKSTETTVSKTKESSTNKEENNSTSSNKELTLNESKQKRLDIANQLVNELSVLIREDDTMSDSVWFYNTYLENYTNRYQVSPYISAAGDVMNPESYTSFSTMPTLKASVRYSYVSSEAKWLFINDDIMIKTDTNRYDIPTSYNNWERDNSAHETWEWTHVDIKSTSMYLDMANSNSTLIRLQGKKYYDERELTQPEKDALKQILSIYEKYEQLKQYDI
ncbi:hypothetical protein [Enterococcus xiangfangensis]|uniref:hypothetical protein n=1 Tax=Enterococcus xiangfangensis TaxID=1296537 RepID=UPI003D164723|nr:hypothetical protein [Enterococcus asini]